MRCGCACRDPRSTVVAGSGAPLFAEVAPGLCRAGIAVGEGAGACRDVVAGAGACRDVIVEAGCARGGLEYVEAAGGTLTAAEGARGTWRCSMRTGGGVRIAVVDDTISLGTLTRLDRTSVCPLSDAAGTADNAPGTARLTCRAGGPLARSLALTPYGRLNRAQQLDEHLRQPG